MGSGGPRPPMMRLLWLQAGCPAHPGWLPGTLTELAREELGEADLDRCNRPLGPPGHRGGAGGGRPDGPGLRARPGCVKFPRDLAQSQPLVRSSFILRRRSRCSGPKTATPAGSLLCTRRRQRGSACIAGPPVGRRYTGRHRLWRWEPFSMRRWPCSSDARKGAW